MLAAFQVGRGDSSIDPIAECCRVSDITVVTYQVCWVTILALSAGLCPVPVLVPAVLRAVFLAATVHRATSARAASAILKRSRQKSS